MTLNLHAHVQVNSSDCDGFTTRDYVETPDAVTDQHADDFKGRVLASVVSWVPDGGASVQITSLGFSYSEPTDEGGRGVVAVWCSDDCDLDESSQRDLTAERAGY